MKKTKSIWTATNERDGSEIYNGTSETEAARAARAASERNGQLQSMAPAKAVVRCDGIREYYYSSDPTLGRMRAQKIHYSSAETVYDR